MKILQIGHHKPIRDGIADHNTLYLKHLKAIPGLSITVLHNQDEIRKENGVEYLRFNPLTFSRQVKEYDLIHFEFGASFRGDYANWCFFLLPRAHRPKVVSTLHDLSTLTLSKYYRILTEAPPMFLYSMVPLSLGRILKNSDACIVYSEHFRRILSVRHSTHVKKLHVLFHGADLPVSRPKHPSVFPLRLCSFGAVSPRKGYEVPIAAVMELVAEGVDLVYDIYGQAPFGFYLERVKRRAAGCDRIRFPGYIPEEKIVDTLQQYDIIILPRKYVSEGGSGSLCHAMSSLVPVLGSKVGYYGEYLSHGKTGFLVDHNKDTYKGTILQILAEKSDLKNISENCLDFVRTELHWPVVCRRHVDLYQRLMS